MDIVLTLVWLSGICAIEIYVRVKKCEGPLANIFPLFPFLFSWAWLYVVWQEQQDIEREAQVIKRLRDQRDA